MRSGTEGQVSVVELTPEVEALANQYRTAVPATAREKALAELRIWEALPKEARCQILKRDCYNSKWLPVVLKSQESTTDFIARDRLLKAERSSLPVELGWRYLDGNGSSSSRILKAITFAKQEAAKVQDPELSHARYSEALRESLGMDEQVAAPAPKQAIKPLKVVSTEPEPCSTPVNVPTDYRELYDIYRQDITCVAREVAVEDSVLVAHLRAERVIEDFDLAKAVPSVMSHEEAIAYLGVTPEFWAGYLRRTDVPGGAAPWRHPSMVRGTYKDPEAAFSGPDIHAIGEKLDERKYARKRPVCHRIADSFRHRLTHYLDQAKSVFKVEAPAKSELVKPAEPVVEAVVKDPVAEAPAWPTDLPRDDQEMVRMYGEEVFKLVARISKVKTEEELEEVSQHVWLKIVQSNVRGKFIQASKTKLPRTLTLSEAIGYLGVTKEQWAEAVELHRKDKDYWLPTPVQGTHLSVESLFLTSDIQTLDESSHFMVGVRSERLKPGMTGRGFKSYLLQSVKNHFKNLLRQRDRRHKERPADPRAVFAYESAGSYRRVATLEDGTSWEDSLSDSRELSMEDLIDLASKLRKYNVDPRSEQGMFVIDYVARGHTLTEALRAQAKGVLQKAL